jgi:hypothetical protein
VASRPSIGQGLADDVFKVAVHLGIRARLGTKENPAFLGGAGSFCLVS